MINIPRVEDNYNDRMLTAAQNYADEKSTCLKVKVGSIILIKDLCVYVYGCNHGMHKCNKNGCRRIALYGNASKEHRLPSDCDAVHSEIDAISKCAKAGLKTDGAIIYVSRYPCENCARAIAESGIKKVVYGRKESISPYTALILASAGVEVVHVLNWEREDNNE